MYLITSNEFFDDKVESSIIEQTMLKFSHTVRN